MPEDSELEKLLETAASILERLEKRLHSRIHRGTMWELVPVAATFIILVIEAVAGLTDPLLQGLTIALGGSATLTFASVAKKMVEDTKAYTNHLDSVESIIEGFKSDFEVCKFTPAPYTRIKEHIDFLNESIRLQAKYAESKVIDDLVTYLSQLENIFNT